ncbi:hypothetical protein [Pseudomonas carassii]|uniref:Uncharacterized protein n=1 Tax=Pseudomonas carassii TaxID=3115855 RepID=A0ABU7H5V1_9PSED|nr:hypothetical protein [Pseudomonas sp. 137P]MEE1886699.1 hypothetical protein [Pseudomonas sp. 137P]
MAYEIHIVKTNSIKQEERTIALKAWQSLCAKDPSLKLENAFTWKNPGTGETITLSERNTAVWTSPLTQQTYPFDYRRGVISFVYHEEAIAKAKEIAKALAATVEGDEGEAY